MSKQSDKRDNFWLWIVLAFAASFLIGSCFGAATKSTTVFGIGNSTPVLGKGR